MEVTRRVTSKLYTNYGQCLRQRFTHENGNHWCVNYELKDITQIEYLLQTH